jgi:hypothetical protein
MAILSSSVFLRGGEKIFFWQVTEQLRLRRRIYGFDSFEGLSEPHAERDLDFWRKGQYTCSLEQVAKNVQAAARPRIKLVKVFLKRDCTVRTRKWLRNSRTCGSVAQELKAPAF